MWHEAEGGRGANQIASCLFRHFLDEIPGFVTHVTLFSDSCSGQNRNSHVSAMLFTVLQLHSSVKTIDHVFLETGHTRLECDAVHSKITRAKTSVEIISVPDEWFDLVSKQYKVSNEYPEGDIKVVRMTQDYFYDFAALLKGLLVLRKETVLGEPFNWFQTQVFSYRQKENGLFYTKSKISSPGYSCLSFNRRGKRSKDSLDLKKYVTNCYSGPLPMALLKKADLLKFLPLLAAQYRDFYRNLKVSEAVAADVGPDIPFDEAASQRELQGFAEN